MKLTPGKFYADRGGNIWCCYKADESEREHCQARCANIRYNHIEYFFLDGRYEEHTTSFKDLVEETEYRTSGFIV